MTTQRLRRRIPEEERREQILHAAFTVSCGEGLRGLTVRGVAAEAGVSHALVLFHFRTRERLVQALLDWLIVGMAVLRVSDDVASLPHARDRLHALLEQELERVSQQPEHTRLFLEFWVLGTRDPEIRARLSAELERYRCAFRSIMEELLVSDAGRLPHATADGLAAVAVSWIHGCAVQAMVDPTQFDTAGYLEAVRDMIGGTR
jgi:TetR/AcrR family transcriptional regulator, transcriptional repressor of bet genes